MSILNMFSSIVFNSKILNTSKKQNKKSILEIKKEQLRKIKIEKEKRVRARAEMNNARIPEHLKHNEYLNFNYIKGISSDFCNVLIDLEKKAKQENEKIKINNLKVNTAKGH